MRRRLPRLATDGHTMVAPASRAHLNGASATEAHVSWTTDARRTARSRTLLTNRLIGTLTGSVRLGLSIALAGFILLVGVNLFTYVREGALRKARVWVDEVVPSLDSARFGLKTTWRGGELRYQLRVRGSTRFLTVLSRDGTLASVSIELSDADGFTVTSRAIAGSELHVVVDDTGGIGSLYWEGSDSLAAADARTLREFRIAWGNIALDAPEVAVAPPPASVVPPSPPPTPRWRNVARWRKLSPTMLGDSVRALLGEPTRVDRYSTMVVWHYGSFGANGDVTFDARMRVTAWTEPRF